MEVKLLKVCIGKEALLECMCGSSFLIRQKREGRGFNKDCFVFVCSSSSLFFIGSHHMPELMLKAFFLK